MNRAHMLVTGMMLIAAVGCGAPEESAPAETATLEWTTLFDGSTLDGWNLSGDANWSLDESDDSVMADSGTGFLVTPVSYANFEMRLEFWVDEPANSGIFMRCQDPNDIGASSCYEVNIYDTREDPTYRTGAIVNVAEPSEFINAGGQWNTYEIRADGSHLTVTLNGIQTVDVEDSTHASGPIGLQYSAGVVKFRNVQIREL